MPSILEHACNIAADKGICGQTEPANPLVAEGLTQPPLSPKETKAQPTEPTCQQMQAVHDSSLTAHMDAYTGGQYTGQGISQNQVNEMLHSSAFSAKEKGELKTISLMMPDAAELFKVHDLTRAKLGAYTAWSCKE